MADSEERIKIQFDTNAETAKKSVDGLNASIDVSVDENEKLAKSFKTVNDAGSKVTKSIKDLNATFEDVYGNLKPLTARMGEAEDRLYELALAGKTTSKEYKDLLEVVANYRKTQIQTDLTVDAAATTLGQKLGGAAQIAATGVQGVTAGMALFGNQSEETEKALLKVQAAMSFADSISNVSNLGGQFRVLQNVVKDTFAKIVAAKATEKAATEAGTVAQIRQNLAVLANPYVIAAAAIAALTVGVYAWVKANSEAEKQEVKVKDSVNLNKLATDNLTQSIEESKKATSSSNDIEVLRAKAYGATDAEIQKIIKSQKELAVSTSFTQSKQAYDNLLKANSDYSKALRTNNEDIISSAKENQAEAKELYKSANDSVNDSIIEQTKFTLQSQIELNLKSNNVQKSANEQAKKEREERRNAELKAIEDFNKQVADKELALLKQIQDANAISAQEKLDLQKSRDAMELEALVKKGADIANLLAYNNEIYASKQLEIDQANLEAKQKAENDSFALDADAAIKRGDQEKQISDAMIAQKQAEQASLAALGQAGLNSAKDIFGKNKAIQKGVIASEGGVALGKLAVNTVEAVGKDNAASPLTFGMPWAGIHIATGALGAASIIANTSKALKAVGGGGSAGSAPQLPSVRGASATPQAGFQASSENQIATSIASNTPDAPVVKAYVVAQDMTDQQAKDAKLVSQNSFGGLVT